jgi:hypothetical protein
MIIPIGFGHIIHVFSGNQVPRGAAITYGVEVNNATPWLENVAIIHAALAANFLPTMSTEIQLDETIGKLGPNSTGPFVRFSDVAVGENTGATMSPQVAVLGRKVTALGGRKNRGRMYIPGLLDASVISGGLLESATRIAWQANVAQHLVDLETNDTPMVILHNSSSDPTTVVNISVDARVATQRRRVRA